MSTIPPDTQKILDALKQIAVNTLDRKQRLGHYAVIWCDGKSICVGEDAPSNTDQEQRDDSTH